MQLNTMMYWPNSSPSFSAFKLFGDIISQL